uniref:RRM Nup35-type domain-containing protein n=1 Tax=Kalmanozyma brasiliensis (strain GHG001) TaxID=1365824 RepID=V5EPT7_KALBG
MFSFSNPAATPQQSGYLSRTKVVKPYKLPARQAEPTSPEAAFQDADSSIAFGTPASKSGKEESTPSSKGQPSPVGRFSSSFFNERRDDASFSRAGSVGPGTPWRGGKESIFGAGGLRGGRPSATPAPASSSAGTSGTPARKISSESPGRTSRSNSTPPAAANAFKVGQNTMDQDDDDDAPPQERLEDEASAAAQSSFLGTSSGSSYANNFRSDSAPAQNILPGRSALSTPSNSTLQRTSPSLAPTSANGFESASPSGREDASSERNSALGLAQRTVLVYGHPAWMEKAVLELFASIGGVELIEAIDLTGSGSAQEQATTQPSSPQLSCCTRIRYAESFQALHALRRNGEVVAGACMVGVRWEDDNFHQVALTNGIDAIFRMDVFPSSRTAETYKASSKPIAVPSIDAATGASAIAAGRNGTSLAGSNGSNGQNNRQSIVPSNNNRSESGVSTTSGAASGSNNVSYPAFGRPLSVINDPSIAFKPAAATSSPFKAASSLFGSGASTAPKPIAPAAGANAADKKPAAQGGNTGVLGRITDGIFGW